MDLGLFEKEVVRRIELENGVRVVVDAVPESSSVALAVLLKGGVYDEADAQLGVTHLYEHLLFRHSGGWNALQIAEEVDVLGGEINAYTGIDCLVLYGVFPRTSLERGLALFRRLILDTQFREDEIAIEKQVVAIEIGEAEDTPEDVLIQKLSEVLWGQSRYAAPIFGTTESLESLTVADLQNRQQELLKGCRIVVAAAGAVEADTVARWASDAFAGLERGMGDGLNGVAGGVNGGVEACVEESPVMLSGHVYTAKAIGQVHVALAWPWFTLRDANYYSGMLWSYILGGGSSSRLCQLFRESKGLCYDISASLVSYPQTGALIVSTVVSNDNFSIITEGIRNEVMCQRTAALDEGVFQRALMFHRAQLVMERDDIEARMFRALLSEKDLGFYRSRLDVLERLEHLTPDDVHACVDARFAGASESLSVVGEIDLLGVAV